MDLHTFVMALHRLRMLDGAEAAANGVALSALNQRQFDLNPVDYFLRECGPTRQEQIWRLIRTGAPRAAAHPLAIAAE